jgi:hypothetical protein
MMYAMPTWERDYFCATDAELPGDLGKEAVAADH